MDQEGRGGFGEVNYHFAVEFTASKLACVHMITISTSLLLLIKVAKTGQLTTLLLCRFLKPQDGPKKQHYHQLENPIPVFGPSKIADCSFVHLSFGPHAAAVPLDNSLDYGQANAGAVVFISTVQPLEDAEDLMSLMLIKANTIVLDVIDGFASLSLATNLNDCGLFRSGVLDVGAYLL